MKTPKKNLWNLIKRMSPAEKRYFKTHFASAKNRHTLLFDLLNQQAVYDENATRFQLNIEASQFKVIKAQLQRLLFKSLLAGQTKKTALSSLRIGLEEVDILLEKQLFLAAKENLNKLLKTSKQFGYSLYQYEIRERLQTISFLELDSTDIKASSHQATLHQLTSFLDQRQRLNRIRLQLEEWNSFQEGHDDLANSILNKLELVSANQLDLPGYLSLLLNTGLCKEILGAPKEATYYRSLAEKIFEKAPKLKKELPLDYLRVLKSLSYQNSWQPSLADIDLLCEKAQVIIKAHPQYSPHYIYFIWAKLRALFILKKFDTIINELEQECLKHLDKYQLEHYRIAANIQVVLANTYLILDKPKKVQHYIQQFRASKVKMDQALQLTVNIMELISHWESGDYVLIQNRLLSFRRAIDKTSSKKHPLYILHLDLFRNLAATPFDSSFLASEILLEIPEYQGAPIFKYYTFQNLERWLQAVAVRKPLSEILALQQIK